MTTNCAGSGSRLVAMMTLTGHQHRAPGYARYTSPRWTSNISPMEKLSEKSSEMVNIYYFQNDLNTSGSEQNFGAFFDVGWRPFTSQVQPEVNANFNFQALYHLKIYLQEPPWSWQWWVIVSWQWWVIARTPLLTFPEFSLRLSLPMERTTIPWSMSHTKISTGEPTILYCKAWWNSNVLNL